MSAESSEAITPSSDQWGHSRVGWWLLALVGCGLIAYGNCWQGEFVFDDIGHVVDSQVIRTFPPPVGISPRMLLHFSLAMNYALGELEPAGYHVFNVTVHLLAGACFFGIVRRILSLERFSALWYSNANLVAFCMAAIWVVHPLQTQSVTYVVQRCEAMMGLFFFACLYCLLRGATSANWRRLWYAACVLSFALALLSKEVAASLPLVALLFDRMFLAKSWREVLAKRWALYVVFAMGIIWLLTWLQYAIVPLANEKDDSATVGVNMRYMTPWMYLRSQPKAILHYLRLSFWPDRLVLDPLWAIEEHVVPIYYFGALILALIAGSLWLYFARHNPLGFLGLAFFLALAPSSSFVPINDIMFEHRMYVSLSAVVAMVVLGLAMGLQRLLPNRWPAALLIVCLVLTAGLAYRTRERNVDYCIPGQVWHKWR